MQKKIELVTEQANDSREARRKSAEKFVTSILSEVECVDFLRILFFKFTGTHIQSRQCQAVAHFLGVDAETVRRWLHGITTPKFRDVWPVVAVVLFQEQPIAQQRETVCSIFGEDFA